MNELMNAVKELKGGSAAAFQLVYEQTRTVALAVIRKYCDNPSDHEDILQETYLKVYKYIGQLDDDEKIQPWINRIAANTAVRYNMKKKPMMFSELADEEGNIPDFEDESGRFSPEIITGRQALSQIVDEILNTLPEDQRTALWMVYGQKITIREMAENSGITVFLCTHQLRYAQEICTRYGLIEEGSLLASGTLEELREEAFSEITLQIRADKMPPGTGFKKTGAQEYETAVRSEKEIPEIVRRIAAAGGDIYGVEAKEPDLEDIYFALTASGREGL